MVTDAQLARQDGEFTFPDNWSGTEEYDRFKAAELAAIEAQVRATNGGQVPPVSRFTVLPPKRKRRRTRAPEPVCKRCGHDCDGNEDGLCNVCYRVLAEVQS